MAEKNSPVKLRENGFALMETPRPPEGIIEGYRALGDATGIISDVMDELGITGVVGAAVLEPTIAGRAHRRDGAHRAQHRAARACLMKTARQHVNKMAEFEAHNLARPW